MDQTRILKLQQQAEEETAEPGFWDSTKERLNRVLQEKVANPFAASGYGDVGAGIAAGVSTAADTVLPSDRKINEPLAAEGLYVRLGDGPLRPLEATIAQVRKQLSNQKPEVIEMAVKRLKESAKPMTNIAEAQRQSKSGEALSAIFSKPEVNATVKPAQFKQSEQPSFQELATKEQRKLRNEMTGK